MTTTTDVASGVWQALATVRDPELDEPITDLGFVALCDLSSEGTARVRLRLPTYFCAPNFAFLMVADAYDAVAAAPGVASVEVVLEDHFAAEAINDGVAARAGFVRSFPGEARAELDELRVSFLRKAVLAGTDQVCRSLLDAQAGGLPAMTLSSMTLSSMTLCSMTLGDAPPSPARERLRQRRAELGLPAGDDDPLVIDPVSGAALPPDDLPLHLRKARVTRVGIDANTSICSGMLRHRYPEEAQVKEVP